MKQVNSDKVNTFGSGLPQ